MIGFQYTEFDILKQIFGDLSNRGSIVEIGAGDGVDNSNSYELIRHYDWDALLVEPHPGYFMDLLKLYGPDYRYVWLSNYAVSDKECRKRLGLDGQCSSLVHKKAIEIEVQCVTLTQLLDLYKVYPKFTFLSIDCEGEDMNILRSLDWQKYTPKCVCVEHSMPQEELHGFMESVGYKFFDKTIGNSFFVKS